MREARRRQLLSAATPAACSALLIADVANSDVFADISRELATSFTVRKMPFLVPSRACWPTHRVATVKGGSHAAFKQHFERECDSFGGSVRASHAVMYKACTIGFDLR